MGKKFEAMLVDAATNFTRIKGENGNETRYLIFARQCVIEHGLEVLKKCVLSDRWMAEFAYILGAPSSFRTRAYLKKRFEEEDE